MKPNHTETKIENHTDKNKKKKTKKKLLDMNN